jgi:plastocyanin
MRSPDVPYGRRATSAVTVLAFTVMVSACASGAMPRTHSGTASPHRTPTRVTISNYAYQPVKLTVARGTEVTFTNHDQTAHTATATGTKARFDSGTINPGMSATIMVNEPGTYTYYCQFHAFMHGTITVR